MITGIFVLLIMVGLAFYFFLSPFQKVKQIQSSVVVEVDKADTRYPDLPLGKFGIFYTINQQKRVRIIFPKLTPEGDVQYIYSWHGLESIHVPAFEKVNSQNKSQFRAAQELALLIKEHLQLEPEILNLRENWQKISNLLDLVAMSDFYASQQEIYERALLQIENLLKKAEELQNLYVRLIREGLIGSQIMGYSPDLLPGVNLSIDTQYTAVRTEYQIMKDAAIAYAELLQTKHLNKS